MAVKWGLLSTARINDSILAAAARSVEADVVGVASRSWERAESYAQAHTIPRAFESYEALLADRDIEVVYISLPNSMHVEWSIRAMRAGKHVLCEKPLTRRAKEVRQVFAVAAETGMLVMEGLMYRHHPQTRTTRDLVRENAIGRVLFARAALSFELKGPDIRLSSNLEGGAMMDLGCYCISSLRLIGGEPEAVLGAQLTTAEGVDTRFFATLLFRDEIVGQFDIAMTMPFRSQLEIVGTGGSIIVDDPWICARPGIELRRGDKVEKIEIQPVDHYQLEIDNMSRAIRKVEPLLLDQADALGQANTIEALYLAAATGQRVSVERMGK
jgi:xylose dehydrogenase (NAD/NADP)